MCFRNTVLICIASCCLVQAGFAQNGSAQRKTLIDAVRAGDRAAVQSLLKQRADVNAAEPDGSTALAWAVESDDLELTQLLLKA